MTTSLALSTYILHGTCIKMKNYLSQALVYKKERYIYSDRERVHNTHNAITLRVNLYSKNIEQGFDYGSQNLKITKTSEFIRILISLINKLVNLLHFCNSDQVI